jgi:hypothetical protein
VPEGIRHNLKIKENNDAIIEITRCHQTDRTIKIIDLSRNASGIISTPLFNRATRCGVE